MKQSAGFILIDIGSHPSPIYDGFLGWPAETPNDITVGFQPPIVLEQVYPNIYTSIV